MKKAILFLMTILSCGIAHSATLTPNNVPKVNTGGSTPKIEDSSIWNQGSNVGIGTTDPQYSLDVAGDINAVTDITVNGTSVCLSDATNCPPFLNGWTDAGTSVVLTTSSDNVGIGTINPQAKLHVKGGIIADGSFSGMLLGNNMKIDGDTTRKMTFSQTAGTYNENVRFDLDTTTNTWAIDSTSGVTAVDMSPFTVTASAFVGDGSGLTGLGASAWTDGGTNIYASPTTDNVAIGTTTPTTKLTVVGTVTATSFVGDGSGLTGLPAGGGWVDGGTNIYASPTTDNVAIGTTTPTQKLTVVGTVSATAFTGDGSALTGIGSGGWTDGGTNVYTTATTDNVGIGTTTPSTTIEIVKQSSQHPLMVSSTATGDGDYLIVRSSGNVGIGTTIPLTGVAVRGSPVTLFSVTSTGTSGSSSGAGIQGYVDDGAAVVQGDRLAFYTFGGSADTGDTMLNGGAITGFANGTYSATSAPTEIRFETAPVGSTTRVANMVVKDTGLVGIGTLQPTGALNVVGDELRVGSGGTNTNATSAGEAYVQGDLEVDGTIYGDGSQLTGLSAGGWTDNGASVIPTTTSDQISIGTTTPVSGAALTVLGTIAGSGSGPLSITNGNVGIGTFATPTVLLHIGNTAGTPTSVGANDVYIQNDLEVDGTVYMGSCSGAGCGTGGGWTDGGANIYTTTTSDNVGIGTASPARELEIKEGAILIRNTTDSYPELTFRNNNNNSVDMGYAPSSDSFPDSFYFFNNATSGTAGIRFATQSAERMFISSTGNVGIGSTAPNGSLDIRNTTTSIGWSIQNAANQACNTTCTAGCVMGMNTGALGNFLPCTDATADTCLCAGSN